MRKARLSPRWISLVLCAFALAANAALETCGRGKAKHVVLVVWDGMRPEFLSETNAPTLWKFSQSGVIFRNHHSVFPSLTNVNSTALATGVFPARSGLLANYEYRPEFDLTKFIRTDDPKVVRAGDARSAGKYLATPTIAELVQARGGRSAIAGGKTTALLHDRDAQDADAKSNSAVIFSGEALPNSFASKITKLLGTFPDQGHSPGTAGDNWTTRAFLELLWATDVPEYSVLWLSEPDRAQHETGPGSDAALSALKASDENFAKVVRALEQKGVRDQTDVIVASDHGFSTIQRAIDLRGMMRDAGFTVLEDRESPKTRGEVRVVGNGGTALFYITEHDTETANRLVEWLQQSDFAGVLFARSAIEGTFPLSQVHLDTVAAPDLVMAFRWNDQKNEHGVPGLVIAIESKDMPKGTHGSLSKFDLHNTLIAAGPDFRAGVADDLPTNSVDVAATILHLLGLPPAQSVDGRVLAEGLRTSNGLRLAVKSSTLETTRHLPSGTWRQYLRTSKVGDEIYVDEGNGQLIPPD